MEIHDMNLEQTPLPTEEKVEIHIENFENAIAHYFGAPYAVATDSCTHAIELCLRLLKPLTVTCPKHTYLSIPMTFMKLGLSWNFVEEQWEDYYRIGGTPIIDAATLWQRKGYVPYSFMCLSFQFKKHIKLGRGGMILVDNEDSYKMLKKMSYDGREPGTPWAEQSISTVGYHYYMTPETAQIGLMRYFLVKDNPPQKWTYQDYPDLSMLPVFQNL